MLTEHLINTIRQQIAELYQQIQSIDQRNQQIKSQTFQYREYFNPQLFKCNSTQLKDYVAELEDNFNQLLVRSNTDLILLQALGEKVTDQLTALTQMIRSNEIAINEHFYQQHHKKRRYQAKRQTTQFAQQPAAQAIMRNSHQLHQELTENHQFERRLTAMINHRQHQIPQADPARVTQLQREILALHQRLGRCRRAITLVEERIALADQKTKH